MYHLTLKPLYHRGKENIALHYPYNKMIDDAVRRIKGIRFSRTHRCWYTPLDRQFYLAIKQTLQAVVTINAGELKKYLEQKQSVKALATKEQLSRQRAYLLMQYPLSSNNLQAFKAYQHLIILKGYSPNTFRTYCNEFHCLLRLLKDIEVQSLSKKHIQSYLLWLLQKKGYSETHIHTAVNAIKFYFEKVEKRGVEFYDLPRPKKPQKLPAILSEKEIVRLFKAIRNVKHRAVLMTCYAAGLRVSEVSRLQIRDIDSERMMMHIHGAKGKKDRMVPLSAVLLQTLREYFKQCRPVKYLFEGEGGKPYSTRSVQIILAQAKKGTGILKQGSVHMLRHSYATHLMEAGVDVRYIQEFLGHSSLATTMRYTHVSMPAIKAIKSPLDRISMK